MRRRLAEMSPKTLTGAELQLDDGPARDAELFLVDGNNLAYRAFYALPEELATSDGFADERAARLREHALQAARRLPAEGRRRRLGHAARCTAPRRGSTSSTRIEPQADAGPAARAVPVLPADRRGLRLPQPRVRGLGGGRRDRHARDTAPTRPGSRRRVVSTDRDAFQLVSDNVDADDDRRAASPTSTSTRPSASSCATASRPSRCRTSSA